MHYYKNFRKVAPIELKIGKLDQLHYLRFGTAGAIFNSTHGHLGQNHSKEGAPIELKMAPAVIKSNQS